MEPWALSDLFIYVIAGMVGIVWHYGPLQLAILSVWAVPFFTIRLPLRIFANYYTRSYEARLPFSRRHTALEYYCVEGARWLLSHLNGEIIGYNVLFGKRICVLMYNWRRFRYGIDETGDSYREDVHNDLFSGYWIKSRSRAQNGKHDIVVYYSPGNMMGFTSSYAYLEYLSILLVTLIEQGFSNPAIFCIETNWNQGYTLQLHSVSMGWEYTCTQCSDSVRVMAGDGPGATALMAVMLHGANPFKSLVPMSSSARLRPDSAILISPLAKIAKTRITNENDWVSSEILRKFAVKLIDSEESNMIHTKPGIVYSSEWWQQALPELGTYITYGQEETCATEVEQIATNLVQAGKVMVEAEPDHVHAWPLVDIYLGRSKLGRTHGITTIATQIAYMTLWKCLGQ